jgi:DNA-binding transcriptional LysR family regulator
VDLDQIEIFLVLAEELHFGRTAARVHLTQPRVSRLLVALERGVGGVLVERTSRRVRLTRLGEQLRSELQPAYDGLRTAYANARAAAQGVRGTLAVGFTATSASERVAALIRSFVTRFPGFSVTQRDVDFRTPYVALRSGEIDVLINWLHGGEPGVIVGPAIDRQRRVLAVSADHPLADRASISIEAVADLPTPVLEDGRPVSLHNTLSPPRTPGGRTIHRAATVRSMTETLSLVAAGSLVHPTTEGVQRLFARRDIAWIPIVDLPPVELGLHWLADNANPCLRAFADIAELEFSPDS